LVVMDLWTGDWKNGRWIDSVEEWQRTGRPGGKPPGVRDLAPPVKKGEPSDYRIQDRKYLSRPEVRFLHPFIVKASARVLICGMCLCRLWKACS
jgi:hypothetical protein